VVSYHRESHPKRKALSQYMLHTAASKAILHNLQQHRWNIWHAAHTCEARYCHGDFFIGCGHNPEKEYVGKMANTTTTTRSRGKGNGKENPKGQRPSVGDNNKQQKYTADVKHKYDQLNKTVESLREVITCLEKKQLTEEDDAGAVSGNALAAREPALARLTFVACNFRYARRRCGIRVYGCYLRYDGRARRYRGAL
jgi:hypothetical protein